MEWFDDVRLRAKAQKQGVVFAPATVCWTNFLRWQSRADRRALVVWALDLAAEAALRLKELLPDEKRPAEALDLAWLWARGKVKMPIAKRAILACHAVAKEDVGPEAAALCHAVGQACAVVHARGHALGFAVYELTAIARRDGVENCAAAVQERVREYMARLLQAQEAAPGAPAPGRSFWILPERRACRRSGKRNVRFRSWTGMQTPLSASAFGHGRRARKGAFLRKERPQRRRPAAFEAFAN